MVQRLLGVFNRNCDMQAIAFTYGLHCCTPVAFQAFCASLQCSGSIWLVAYLHTGNKEMLQWCSAAGLSMKDLVCLPGVLTFVPASGLL